MQDKLDELREEVGRAPKATRSYTVSQAVAEWLESGLPGPSERTKILYAGLLSPVLVKIGHRPLKDLTDIEVRKGLESLSSRYSKRSLQITALSSSRLNSAGSIAFPSTSTTTRTTAPSGTSTGLVPGGRGMVTQTKTTNDETSTIWMTVYEAIRGTGIDDRSLGRYDERHDLASVAPMCLRPAVGGARAAVPASEASGRRQGGRAGCGRRDRSLAPVRRRGAQLCGHPAP